MIEKRTCISFKQRTNEVNYVKVVSKDGCHSKLGMVGGEQEISLEIGSNDEGCLTTDTVAHEFIHALGKINFLFFYLFISF